MAYDRFHLVGYVGVVLAVPLCAPASTQDVDPHKLLEEADRLAWLRVWTRAEALYGQAREAFARSGDNRNALYAEVSQLRRQLPTLPVPEVSERLNAYLDDPVIENDELRLRVLIIKGETDEDLDPFREKIRGVAAIAPVPALFAILCLILAYGSIQIADEAASVPRPSNVASGGRIEALA